MEESASPVKYIPPHQRTKITGFTLHARERQQQRNISNESIKHVAQSGEIQEDKKGVTFRDEHTQLVLGKGGKVITVLENRRNTRFDLLNTSKIREQKLIKNAKRGNDHAMCELSELYLSGDLGNREVKEAQYWLTKAANEKKNSHAMCLLSQLFESGDLGKSNPETALFWLEKAAERNNRYALAVLGQKYLSQYLKIWQADNVEENVKKDQLKKVQQFLTRSADKGSTRAMWQIAQMHEEGWSGEKNIIKAIEIYSKAARLGSPASLDSLNKLVQEGAMDSKVFEEILEEASQLIAKTSSDLAVDIGLKQIHGLLGNNPQRGLFMLEKAAEKRNITAIKTLAKYYRDGKGCEVDLLKSQYWVQQLGKLLEQATAQGNVKAMWDLGHLYLSGGLGEINLEKAEELFIWAAQTHDIESIYYLGTLYIEGRLGDKDPAEGIPWIRKAIDAWEENALKGDVEAPIELSEIYLNKRLGFKNYKKAEYWLLKAGEQGNTNAIYTLAKLYLKGKLGQESILAAIDLIEKIIDQEPLEEVEKIRALRLLKKYLNPENHLEVFKRLEKKVFNKIVGDAEKDNINAMLLLLQFHLKGTLSVYIDHDAAIYWAKKFENAFNANDENKLSAIFLLGKLYKEGSLLPKNLTQAAKCLYMVSEYPDLPEVNSELNNLLAGKEMNAEEKLQIVKYLEYFAEKCSAEYPYRIGRILGDIYTEGKLVEPDIKKAVFWYEKAAQLGNSKAKTGLEKLRNEKSLMSPTSEQVALVENDKKPQLMYEMGMKYLEKSQENPKEKWRAAFWFRKASRNVHLEATFTLAKLYESGELGEKVRPVGVNLYKQSAKQNHLESIKRLIDIYSKGFFVQYDPVKIEKWQEREKKINFKKSD